MDAELEVRQHFLRENEDLRGKLLKFTETYEAQERHVAEQREARTREMEVAQQQLREHETMSAESKVKTASLERQNEVLRKSKTVLWDELQGMISKFDEFQEAVAASSERHGECKTEVDGLQSRLQDLEKENSGLRAGKDLEQLTQEQQVAQKQRDALERLCDNLQKENKKLQEQLLQLRGAKPGG
jgi:predicted  nucleic acid-binding Zn-ribbon protein